MFDDLTLIIQIITPLVSRIQPPWMPSSHLVARFSRRERPRRRRRRCSRALKSSLRWMNKWPHRRRPESSPSTPKHCSAARLRSHWWSRSPRASSTESFPAKLFRTQMHWLSCQRILRNTESFSFFFHPFSFSFFISSFFSFHSSLIPN